MADIRFDIKNSDFERAFKVYTDLKLAALKQLYHSMGQLYKEYVKEILPTDDSEVYRAFKYRVVPTKYDIRLSCGILFKEDLDKIRKFYNWILSGSAKHWVSLKHLKVLQWSLKNGIIKEDGGKYYFVQKPLYYSSGTPKSIRAVEVSSPSITPYLYQIQRNILLQLKEEMVRTIVRSR